MFKKIKSGRFYIKLRYLKKTLKDKIMLSFIIPKKDKKLRKRIYIFLSCDYGNLGDVAISYAQYNYLKNNFGDRYDIVDVPFSKTYSSLRFYKKTINKNDIITIIGGGNMTNLYDSIEESRRTIIETFKNNIIISFPQTISFSDDIEGNLSLKRSIKKYSKAKNLYIFAREKHSYNLMKKYFGNNKVFLCPDIVFSLNGIVKGDKRTNKVAVCLRDDKEKIYNKNLDNYIKNIDVYDKIDTHVGDEKVNIENRYEILFDFLKKISSYKNVVTDRLHGLIFCYITNTPCIVFDNKNHKIKNTFCTWLEENKLIKFSDVDQKIPLLDLDDNYQNENLSFETLDQVMQKVCK